MITENFLNMFCFHDDGMRRHLKAGHLVVALHVVGVGHVEVGGGGVDVHVHVYRAGVEADWTGKQYFSMAKVSFQKSQITFTKKQIRPKKYDIF